MEILIVLALVAVGWLLWSRRPGRRTAEACPTCGRPFAYAERPRRRGLFSFPGKGF